MNFNVLNEFFEDKYELHEANNLAADTELSQNYKPGVYITINGNILMGPNGALKFANRLGATRWAEQYLKDRFEVLEIGKKPAGTPNLAGDMDLSRYYETDESLNEGSRAKFVQTINDKADKYVDRARKLRDMGNTTPSHTMSNNYFQAADKSNYKGMDMKAGIEKYATTTDFGHNAQTDWTKSHNQEAAARFKSDYNDNSTDKLAQRKPGTFAKEELEEGVTPQETSTDLHESVKQPKQKTVITEAMNREARKNGYRNYEEYLNSNK